MSVNESDLKLTCPGVSAAMMISLPVASDDDGASGSSSSSESTPMATLRMLLSFPMTSSPNCAPAESAQAPDLGVGLDARIRS